MPGERPAHAQRPYGASEGPAEGSIARVDIAAARSQFADRGRVMIRGVLDPAQAEQIAREVEALSFTATANVPIEGTTPTHPQMWFYHSPVGIGRGTRRTPLEDLVHSMTRGALLDLVRAVTLRPRLREERRWMGRSGLVAYAYPRGGYIEQHADESPRGRSTRSVALIIHLSRVWDPSWGGELRFAHDPQESFFPELGALCVLDVGPLNRHEVTMVTGPCVRYSVAGFLVHPTS